MHTLYILKLYFDMDLNPEMLPPQDIKKYKILLIGTLPFYNQLGLSSNNLGAITTV